MDDTSGQSEHIVLLTPQTSATLPSSVVQAGKQRGVTLTHVTNQPAVMVQMHRGASGLIIIDPSQVPYLNELQDAITTYYPKVTWRQYKRHRPVEITKEKNGGLHNKPDDERADTTCNDDGRDINRHQSVKEQTIVAYEQDIATTSSSDRPNCEAAPKIKTGNQNKAACVVTEEELNMLMMPFDFDLENEK